MGRSDIDVQFRAFIRQLIRQIRHAEKQLENADIEEAKKELADILDDLQKSLED